MLIKLAVQFLRCLKLVRASSDFGLSVLTSSKGYLRDRWVINIRLVSFVSDESVSEEEKPCITKFFSTLRFCGPVIQVPRI